MSDITQARRRGQPGTRCTCGCGQKTAETMRQRKLTCDGCGCPLRMTRTWLERNGAPSCGCGGVFIPECVGDRCHLPGEEGAAAWAEYATAEAQRGVARDGRGMGRKPTFQCHACKAFIRHPRAVCSCGFQNDPRPGAGGYTETFYAPGFGARDDIPF